MGMRPIPEVRVSARRVYASASSEAARRSANHSQPKRHRMDTILAVLMFAVLLGSLWDIRRGSGSLKPLYGMCTPQQNGSKPAQNGLPR